MEEVGGVLLLQPKRAKIKGKNNKVIKIFFIVTSQNKKVLYKDIIILKNNEDINKIK